MEASGTLKVAALGRPFSLGMLYDCRKDSLVTGMTLWDRDDLKSHIGERPQNYSGFVIVASESIADKSSALNVEASLKASFLGGLVDVEGSAKYLKDSKTSKNQARVTLSYKTTTKFQELSMDHLGRGKVKHPYVFDQGLATHVVTGIVYGAQAFFVFDCEVSENEDHRDIQGNLKLMINKIPNFDIGGEGSLKMEDKDKANVQKFSCKFFGDFSLEKTPVTFQDAVQVYQSLPKLLGANGENVVPVKVYLSPLTSVDSSAAKLVRQISVGLVQESQNVLEDFTELEIRCNDAMRTTIAQQFPQIGKKLKTFKEKCLQFKLEFQQILAEKLPLIRGGGEEEAVLAEILRKKHSSPFNMENLNEWMDSKEREIYTIMTFTNMMKNTKTISSQTDLYKESLSAEHAVCFVFTSLGGPDPFLSALSKQTPEDPQDPHPPVVEKDQWFTSKEVLDTMRRKAKLFSDFAEANKENKNIKFLAVALTNETQKGSSIYLYKDGFPVSENFEPPSKPETVSKEVLRERQRLEDSVENFEKEIKVRLAKLEEIKETSEQLKILEAEIRRNENFEFEVTVQKPFQVDISGSGNYSTNCQQCHYSCHYPCRITNDSDKAGCPAMGSDGYCTVCPNKCHWTVHFNQKYQWHYKEVKEKRTIKELQEKHNKAIEAKPSIQAMIERLRAEYDETQAQVVKLMQSSAECLNRLKEIVPNHLSTPEYIDILIEGEKSVGRPGWKE